MSENVPEDPDHRNNAVIDPRRPEDSRPVRRHAVVEVISWIARFPTSGLFFMIVGAIFLYISFVTMGRTHAAMSFVFVVVGVAILLYGTGTQGIGNFDSGERAEKVARYKVAMAGGAGVIAFCVAAGIIAFSSQMKQAFRIEQQYLRLQIHGKGYERSDIGLYVPDVRINGARVPAVRREDYIEVYVPYIRGSDEETTFEIKAKLILPHPAGLLRADPDASYNVVLKSDGSIVVDNVDNHEKYVIDSGYDFPRYTLKKPIDLTDPQKKQVAGAGGVTPQ